jgi:hypothetical protein
VTRAFRSDAIVSLQFRRLLTPWIFTVIVRADNKGLDDFAGVGALPPRQCEKDIIFSA